MPLLLRKASVREENRIVFEFIDQMLKGRTIVDIGGITFPVHDATQMVQDEAELTAHNPALVRLALLANLPFAASLSPWMQQLNAVTVNHTQQRRCGHEFSNQMVMTIEEPKQPSPA